MAKKPAGSLTAAMLQAEPEIPAIDLPPLTLTPPVHPGMGMKPPRVELARPVTTTVKLEQPLYLRLKAYCAAHRTNGQAASVEALDAFLTSKGY